MGEDIIINSEVPVLSIQEVNSGHDPNNNMPSNNPNVNNMSHMPPQAPNSQYQYDYGLPQ